MFYSESYNWHGQKIIASHYVDRDFIEIAIRKEGEPARLWCYGHPAGYPQVAKFVPGCGKQHCAEILTSWDSLNLEDVLCWGV